jgi:UDP-N-acetylmuramoylalanine--D-glutamate ligase
MHKEIERLKDKKIIILGLGVNNKNLANYFKSCDITFDVIESWNTPADLIGKIEGYDIVFRTPGLPYNSEVILEAIKNHIEVNSQTKLFVSIFSKQIIGVTGTKGKGTTSSLIADILKLSGKKVFLAGNIGKDPFEFIDQITPKDFIVLELSSFQLQDVDVSPHIAVVTNLFPDHLNHHKTLDEYLFAKLKILASQTENDFAILSPALPKTFYSAGKGTISKFYSNDVLAWKTKLIGEHNLQNIAAAVKTCQTLGVSEEIIKTAVAEFKPLPHRLNILGEMNGVTVVDDSYSTNIEPTLSALESFKDRKVILAMGGHDKKLNFENLIKRISELENIKSVIVFGQIKEQLSKLLERYKVDHKVCKDTMSGIFQTTLGLASTGDVFLFSPATSSFDMFKNETDRGGQFVKYFNDLKNAESK